jgi:hypothetical protein
VHCRHTCAAIRKAAAPVLLPHQWPPSCLRVVCCLAYAHTCGIEPSRPPVEHSRLHPRTRRFNSARTSGSCNSAALSICCDAIRTGLPPPPVMRCASNPCRVAPALTALPLRSCSFRAQRAITAAFASSLLLPARLAITTAASLSVASAAPRRALDVVEPWKEALDAMLFADKLLPNPPLLLLCSLARASAARTSTRRYSSASAAGPALAPALPRLSAICARPCRVRPWPVSRVCHSCSSAQEVTGE